LLELTPELLIEPTTQEVRRALDTRFTPEATAVIIIPAETKGTGEIIVKPKSVNYGSVKTDSNNLLPNDQMLNVDENTYVFICLLELEDKKPSAAIKSLEGGLYRELDLRGVEFIEPHEEYNFPGVVNQLYPYTSMRRINYIMTFKDKKEDNPFETKHITSRECFDLVNTLTTVEGTKVWGSIKPALYYRLIRPTKQYANGEYPILLIGAGAYCLNLYLKPVLERIERGESLGKLLGMFAHWIWLSTAVLATPGTEGFYLRKGKKQYWVLKPSVQAKLAYSSIFDIPSNRLAPELK
jgi:hypothetical protein